jgi:phosphomannomutase
MVSLDSFEKSTRKNLSNWLEGPYDEKTKKEILRLLSENPKEIESSFFRKLSFGTGGIRGLMGVGTNRINQYTIQFAAQGVANYLKKIYPKESLKVIVGFDNRNNSSLFAQESARVFAANGIKAFLFEHLRPTPLISFGCRFLGCHAAVMITASHNPPEYNGFKVYGKEGGQVLPPHDLGIIHEAEKIETPSDVLIAPLTHPLIEKVSLQIDQAYLSQLNSLNSFEKENKKEGNHLQIIYTNLHGTGLTLLPKALENWGFTHLSFVEEQMSFDGNFPHAKKPNPEEKEALEQGLDLMVQKKADLLLATDPDADRIAVALLHLGKPVVLSGNDLACLLLHHLASTLKEKKKTIKNPAVVKSIVTSELFKSIANHFQMTCFDVLTGFKYIAELIEKWEKSQEYTFVFGAEESYGYLAETFVRDKDAISTGCLIAEMALKAKKEKKTLLDLLYQLYRDHGIYQEEVFSLHFPSGKQGEEQMQSILQQLRKNPPTQLCNSDLLLLEDYQNQSALDISSKKTLPLFLPKSNVLRLWLDDNSKIVIRPSGTESKIKIYVGVVERNFSHLERSILLCKERAKALVSAIKKQLF